MSNSLNVFNEISRKLSRETDLQSQLVIVVGGAMDLTNADAGSLYSVADNQCLKFEVVLNRSLEIRKQIPNSDFPDIPLYINDEPNSSILAVNCALNSESIFIDDIYDEQQYNFSGTRSFDKKMDYKTHSILSVPILDFAKKVIGVIQLINAQNADGDTRIFTKSDQELVNLFVFQTAFTLSSKILINKQKELFNSINV